MTQHEQSVQPSQAKTMSREVRMNPKVVFWVVLAASTIALMGFSMMFVHAAFRNGW